MSVSNRRKSDNGDDREFRQRRFWNTATGQIIKLAVALLIGGGSVGGFDLVSSEDHTQIDSNKTEVIRLKEQLDGQEQVFNAKLETLNAKIDAVDQKIEILLRRTERK